MELVTFSFETGFQYVMGHAGHGEVVRAEDSLVVIREVLAADPDEKALLGLQLHPGLVDAEGAAALTAPRAAVLGGQAGRDALSFILETEPGPAEEERREIIRGFIAFYESAVADLAARHVVQVEREAFSGILGRDCQGDQDQDGY